MVRRRGKVLSVNVDVVDMNDAMAVLSSLIRARRSAYVSLVTAHGVMDARRSREVEAAFNEADLAVPDGMAVVWSLALAGYKGARRVYGPDLMSEACSRSVVSGWRHFFFGGDQGVPENLASSLCRQHPGLSVAGCLSPPFGKWKHDDERRLIAAIEESDADIVWVCLGSPRQEVWMRQNTHLLPRSVLIGVGAAFDFLTGRKPQAPRWIQRAGMEWMFRLVTEPRRLWRRYSAYPLFAGLALAQGLQQRLGLRNR